MTEPSEDRSGREGEPQTHVEAMSRAQEAIRLLEVEPVEPNRRMEDAPGALSPKGGE
jgi:hypothetical protein